MEVYFDFNTNCIRLKINGCNIENELRIVDINEYTKMASINYLIDDGWKLTVSWIIYARRQQFLELSEYKRSSDSNGDPWTTMAKWSYISKPQAGTIQDTNVRKFIHNDKKFKEHKMDVDNVKIYVKNNTNYGDWNTINCLNEY